MYIVFDNIRGYWVVTILFSFLLFSCSDGKVIMEEENQNLNRELFDFFMISNFDTKVKLPSDFVLTSYDKGYYKWSLIKEKRVKMTFSDTPDFKATIFDSRDYQLHIVFCELKSNVPICNAIDSINRIVWRITDVKDSLLVDKHHFTSKDYQGNWYLNSKTLGGYCHAKIWNGNNKKLLVYYMSKEYGDDEMQMSVIGDKILNTIDIF